MQKITASDVQRLAALAKLSLSDDEIAQYQGEIEAILGFINDLQQADVDDLEPTEQVTGLKNVFRADELQELPSPEAMLSKANETVDSQFKVKRVMK